MRIAIIVSILAFTYGCSPASHTNLKAPKNTTAKTAKVVSPSKARPQQSASSPMADSYKLILQMVKQDTAELSRLRRGSRVFNGPQRGFGATMARNMVSGFGGNPFASREKVVMARLRSNLNLLQRLNRSRNQYNCDKLTKLQAIDLYKNGHDYLDRDNDGKPCEYIRGKYQY